MIRVAWAGLLLGLTGCDLFPGLLSDLRVDEPTEVPVSDTGGFVDFVVKVPDSPVGTMAWCGEYGDDVLGTVWQVTDPSGEVVYSGYDPEASVFRADTVDDLAAALFPSTPQLPLTGGDWEVQWFIGAGNPGMVECGAIHRAGSPSNNVSVRVEVVLVGLDVDAAAAQTDPNLAQAIDQLTLEWQTAGLTPDVRWRDFEGDVDRFAVVDVDTNSGDYREFNDLLRTSDPSNDATLTFFLVQELRDVLGGTLLGLAAGPPGAAGLHGTSKSGVVVTAADLAMAPTDVGKIMAHEGGHFLGLYHTTERRGTRHDPLLDTPECPSSADSDNNGRLSVAECAGQGGENVMFWTLTEGTSTLTTDQAYVLGRNPIAR
ncbi:MAG: hypothetical protein AAGA48_16475 [Myxococcota bacterium]